MREGDFRSLDYNRKVAGSMGSRNVREEEGGRLQDLDDLEAVRGVA